VFLLLNRSLLNFSIDGQLLMKSSDYSGRNNIFTFPRNVAGYELKDQIRDTVITLQTNEKIVTYEGFRD
jgi:hypothetical protein